MRDFFYEVGIPALIVVAVFCGFIGLISSPWLIFGDSAVPTIKSHAEETWKNAGFSVVGYEGYELTLLGRPGGCVWYVVERNGTTYDGCISKWGNEFHIYSLRSYDAIGGTK